MDIEIWICCYSEKTDVSISCGICTVSIGGKLSIQDTELIGEGLCDSFWENHWEFEAGIAAAKELQRKDSSRTFKQALFDVFGNFAFSYEIEGKEIKLETDLNANELMYTLLVS